MPALLRLSLAFERDGFMYGAVHMDILPVYIYKSQIIRH